MYNISIEQFKKNIDWKNNLESIEYANACLNASENTLIDSRACRNTDNIDEYIDFLRNFISSWKNL